MRELKQTDKAVKDRERYRKKVEAAGWKVGEKQERVKWKFCKTHGATKQQTKEEPKEKTLDEMIAEHVKLVVDMMETMHKAKRVIDRIETEKYVLVGCSLALVSCVIFLIASKW